MRGFQKTVPSSLPPGRWCHTALLVFSALTLGAIAACDRAVGSSGKGDDAGIEDGALADRSILDGQLPDGAVEQELVGWYSSAFEHVGFVLEQDADQTALKSCNPYIFAVSGKETWWAESMPSEAGLPLYPRPDNNERMGLVRVRGYLSPPGQYGHDGSYQRELDVTSVEDLTCETVASVEHCVIPKSSHFCQIPSPQHTTREIRLVRIIQGPSNSEEYQLVVDYDENVMDGATSFTIHFHVPFDGFPDYNGWEAIQSVQLIDPQVYEERFWIYYLRIDYTEGLAGWVLRNKDDEILKISISAGNADEGRIHIWGDFPIDENIYGT